MFEQIVLDNYKSIKSEPPKPHSPVPPIISQEKVEYQPIQPKAPGIDFLIESHWPDRVRQTLLRPHHR